jgi:hypothetical protein
MTSEQGIAIITTRRRVMNALLSDRLLGPSFLMQQ